MIKLILQFSFQIASYMNIRINLTHSSKQEEEKQHYDAFDEEINEALEQCQGEKMLVF